MADNNRYGYGGGEGRYGGREAQDRGYGARGEGYGGGRDDRYGHERYGGRDERGRGYEGRYDARTGDRMGPGDSRAGQFEPGARGGEWAQPSRWQEAPRGGRDRDSDRYNQRGRSSASGLEVFDRSLQTTHIWLNEIIDELGPDKQVAWHALTAVLRTIRDRVQPELAVHLGAQLPLLIRGAYYDQYRLTWEPERTRSLDDFLDSVVDHMRGIGRPINPRAALHAVVRTLSRHISEGQVRKIVDAMPESVRRSWIDACSDISMRPDMGMRH